MQGATGAVALDQARAELAARPRRWLVTGSAGFIGSHLVQTLLAAGQEVVGLDNFSTGHRSNLDEVRRAVGDANWRRHTLHRRRHRRLADLRGSVQARADRAARGGARIRAALDRRSACDACGECHRLSQHLITAARDAGATRFVYAASSSTYGDHPDLPKVEDRIGRPLSPYAVTKYLNELYADVFGRCYGTATVGLRYFNVFGARQDPDGAYAAVIPRWVAAMLSEQPVTIYGDGETTRDFCFVDNVVQANLLAALTDDPAAIGQVYNVAVGGRMSLNELHRTVGEIVKTRHPQLAIPAPRYEPFRAGDVRHSQADTAKARTLLGYMPTHGVREGLVAAMPWYETRVASAGRSAVRAVGD